MKREEKNALSRQRILDAAMEVFPRRDMKVLLSARSSRNGGFPREPSITISRIRIPCICCAWNTAFAL